MDSILTTIFAIALFITLYFEVFLLLTYFENRKLFERRGVAPRCGAEAPMPSVTVIVPCWNEETTLAQTVQSLQALEYPKDKIQIFIINDGSTDGTAQVAQPLLADPRVKYFYKENGGKHSALNLGIKESETDLIGCLDADSFVKPCALSRIAHVFNDPSVMAVTAAIKVFEPKTVIQRMQDTEYTIGILFKKILSCMNAQYVTPGPFSIYRRSIFSQIGLFGHAHGTEDLEMALRMHSKHLRIENVFDAEVYTVAPSTVGALLRQRLRWIYGFIKNAMDYRFMMGRKKYGNLGMFSLPAALISLGVLLYAVFFLLWNTVGYIAQKSLQVATVGFPQLGNIDFDWFFVNTEAISLVAIESMVLFGIILVLGVYRVRGKLNFKINDAYFVAFYGFIAPLWTARAVLRLFSSVPVKWWR